MEKNSLSGSEPQLDIVITGGGAGGHVYPGIAVAKELQRQAPSASIVFIGSQTGSEARIVPHEGFALETLAIQEMKNTEFFHKLRSILQLPPAVYRSFKLLREFRPQVVFGSGGYIAVPVIYASCLLHIPTLLLEANRYAGTANRLLSKSVDHVAICFQETATAFPQEKVVFTGIPIRKEFSVIGKTSPPDKGAKFNILILGGNAGAKELNYAAIEALDYLAEQRQHLVFTHQTGPTDYSYVRALYKKKQFRADVRQYIDDIPKMFAKSHLIICRAGASTVAELRASRRPAILIPYPHDDKDQEFNAKALQEAHLARIIWPTNLSGKSLSEAILSHLRHPGAFARIESNIRLVEEKAAAEQVVAICFQLAKANSR